MLRMLAPSQSIETAITFLPLSKLFAISFSFVLDLVFTKYILRSTLFVNKMKTKMGRPKLPKGEAREIVLATRVNPTEHKAIKGAIKASKQPQTEWLRNALLAAANVT